MEKKVKRKSSGNLETIFRKELADQLSSSRFFILFFLIMVTGAVSFYAAMQSLPADEMGDSGFTLVRLFTTSANSLPPFTWFLSLLGPLVGLAMGFDAINGEQNRGTMSRLLSQPVYRDDVINGKFLARLVVLAIMTAALGGFVGGMGILMTGVAPSGEEILRLLLYLALSVVYMAFWLALSMLFSLLFRQAATSALGGIALWLFFSIFVPLLAGMVADAVFPANDSSQTASEFYNVVLRQNISRLSPSTLYSEASLTLLSPEVRTLGPVLVEQAYGAISGFLPLGQSLLLVWPHLTGLVAATLIIFAAAYTLFLRQEIRA
ncbi:MAG TPA: ABC transporter permease [Thermoanaerobacterales bacterium]|nr:ABC transporter permease [Thermoanaerobacterales bacterium]